jgi:hypothetical protein
VGIAPPGEGTTDIGATVAPGNHRLLRQRLMVMCPETGLAVDTGFDLSAIPNLRGSQILFDCMECGQDHPWGIDETFVD